MCSHSCPTLCDPVDCSPTSLLCPWDSPGRNTGGGRHALLQGIFPTQGSNPHLLCLLRCRQVLSPLNHRGSPAAEKQVTVEGRSLTSSWPENHGRKPTGNSRPARAPWGGGGGAPSPSCTSSASPSAGQVMLSLRGRRSPARAARSAVQPCWAGCALRIAMSPGVPLLFGLGEPAAGGPVGGCGV